MTNGKLLQELAIKFGEDYFGEYSWVINGMTITTAENSNSLIMQSGSIASIIKIARNKWVINEYLYSKEFLNALYDQFCKRQLIHFYRLMDLIAFVSEGKYVQIGPYELKVEENEEDRYIKVKGKKKVWDSDYMNYEDEGEKIMDNLLKRDLWLKAFEDYFTRKTKK